MDKEPLLKDEGQMSAAGLITSLDRRFRVKGKQKKITYNLMFRIEGHHTLHVHRMSVG